MHIQTLNGSWSCARKGSNEIYEAHVPGMVHDALMTNKVIPDPFFRDNEDKQSWVGESDWVYSRDFTVENDLMRYDRVLLKCHGLDTIADIFINRKKVASTDNMHRTWEFDVKSLLRRGSNQIKIHFSSPLKYVAKRNAQAYMHGWGVGNHRVDSGGWIRKQPSNFGWDWGPKLVTSGIWRDIELAGFNIARLENIKISQKHSGGKVRIDVKAEIQKTRRAFLQGKASLYFSGSLVTEAELQFKGKTTSVELIVQKPNLWWPNGMGKQPLYELAIDLLDKNGDLLATDEKRIGLRTLELKTQKDKKGESFAFVINGKQFFAKGANWIPADAPVSRVKPEDYRRLIEDSVKANMNMLRVWGGGIYESNLFYDLCDEYGICLWQDFMFACAAYPAFDDEFVDNVKLEARDNVRRLRHHPCLALWCGNNELEQGLVADQRTDTAMSWTDYKRLFDKTISSVVRREDPERPYWPGSPHSPRGDRSDHRNPGWGDAHLWSVWHGRKPFEWYRTCTHRFISEFGFQSFPEPGTVNLYTTRKDHNITSPVMEHHQRSNIGNVAIIQYMLDWFRMPKNFEMTLWLSQILQGMAMKYGIEHWRRNMPETMGTLYWQLNDCWPVASWSSIDYYGKWKALHYMARKFYAPVLVSGVEHPETGRVDVHVTNDMLGQIKGHINWSLTTVRGEKIVEDRFPFTVSERSSKRVKVLDVKDVMKQAGPEELLVWLEAGEKGTVLSSNLVMFDRPKRMDLVDPELSVKLKREPTRQFVAQVSSGSAALWCWLQPPANIQASFSDNFFHVRKGAPKNVVIETDDNVDLSRLKRGLKAHSIYNTF